MNCVLFHVNFEGGLSIAKLKFSTRRVFKSSNRLNAATTHLPLVPLAFKEALCLHISVVSAQIDPH